jgi:hypothetical protein
LEAQRQARIAQDALRVGQRQADLAEVADKQARRDRQLLESPRIDVKLVQHGYVSTFGYTHPDGNVMVLIARAKNVSDRAAYRIRVQVRGKSERHAAAAATPIAESGIPTLDPDKEYQFLVNIQDFASIGGRDAHSSALTFPWLSVQIRFEGLLGQVVLEEHSYWADGQPNVTAFAEWQRITTSVAGVEPFAVDFSQPAAE